MIPPLFALLHPVLDDPRSGKVLGFFCATMFVGALHCALGVRVRRGKGGAALALLAAGFAALLALGSVAFVSAIIYRVRPEELVRFSSALCAPPLVGLVASAIAIHRRATRHVDTGAVRETPAQGDVYDDVVSATGVFLVAMLGTLAISVLAVAVAAG